MAAGLVVSVRTSLLACALAVTNYPSLVGMGKEHASAQPATQGPPNVVFVLADDLGFNDLSTSSFGRGNRSNETPALDAMAREGTVFPNAYSTPSCSPSRMALLSGLSSVESDNYSFQVGDLYAPDFAAKWRPLKGIPQGPREDDKVALLPRTVTVGEIAQAAGYHTSYIGKFHATTSAKAITKHHGFDVNLGGRAAGSTKQYNASGGRFHRWVGKGLQRFAAPYTSQYVADNVKPFSRGVPERELTELVGKQKNVNDAVGDATLSEVGVGQDPTFTFVGHYTVHSPIEARQARPDLRSKYSRRTRSGERVGYAGLVENMDQTMARLRRHLETTEDPRRPGHMLAENTIVMFTSDNGGRTQLGADNTPFRGQKYETTEGGVRVPFLAWSGNPELVAPGQTNQSVVQNVDLMPTLVDLMGVRPPRHTMSGKSFAPQLTSSRTRSASVLVHLPGYHKNQGRETVPVTTLRRQDGWKLTYRYESRTFFLSNLRANPRETRNYRDRKKYIMRPMTARLLQLLGESKPGLPVVNERTGTIVLKLRRGSRYYREGKLRVTTKRSVLRLRPGTEVPVVVEPHRQARRTD